MLVTLYGMPSYVANWSVCLSAGKCYYHIHKSKKCYIQFLIFNFLDICLNGYVYVYVCFLTHAIKASRNIRLKRILSI